jgi:hypothetical protein
MGMHRLAQLKGSVSQQHAIDPNAYERANYVQVLDNYSSPTASIEVGFTSSQTGVLIVIHKYPRAFVILTAPDLA